MGLEKSGLGVCFLFQKQWQRAVKLSEGGCVIHKTIYNRKYVNG